VTGGPAEGGESTRDGASRRAGYPGPFVYAGIGMLNAICLLGGLALGWLVDSAAGTLPLFLFLGLACGAGLGVAATRAEMRRYRH
jgi:hypothetical protein